MSEAPFRAPRRRPLVHEASGAPLPVPRSAAEATRCAERCAAEWTRCAERCAAEATRCAERVFRADLVQQHVLVLDPAHTQLLYGQGYFGKGILSRGCPGYSLSLRWREFKGQQIPVISQARYEQLLSWRRTFLLNQGLDKEAVNQILVRLSEPIKLATEGVGPGQTKDSSHRKRKRSSPNEQRFTDPDPSPLDDPAPMADSSLEYVLVVGDREEEEEGETREVTSDPAHHGEVTSDPGRHGEVTSDPGRHGEVTSDPGRHGEVRRLPFNTTEVLQLTLEEAFFLVYALGCLSVHHNQKPLSVSEVWRRFRGLQPGFESSYAAYHHYRSRGWVPKTGAKYGAHYMLYRRGPPFYHASYSVVVEPVSSAAAAALRPFSWRSLATLSRITANVSKELMLCYIIYPADQSEAELSSPLSLHRLTVQEVVIKRWVSSRERAEQEDI